MSLVPCCEFRVVVSTYQHLHEVILHQSQHDQLSPRNFINTHLDSNLAQVAQRSRDGRHGCDARAIGR